MDGTKSVFASLGIMGPALSFAAASLSTFFGVEFSPEEQQTVIASTNAAVTAFFAVVGVVTAVYGRFRATKSVTL